MDFQVGKIFSLLAKTSPFLLFRFLVYMAITLAYVLGTGAGAGLGYFVGHIGSEPGVFGLWGGVFGFSLVGILVYWFREYLLYLVKAGHIAVLVELMDGRKLPAGRAQIDHAQKIVRERFIESSVLFGLDQLIKGILRTFNRVFFTVANFIPVPGAQGLVKFVNKVVTLSLTYLDEVILSYNIRTESKNPWKSSQTALILYAQNYKTFLKNAFFLAFFIWGLSFLVFLLALAPAAGLVALFPGTAGFLTLIIALVFAWGVKAAFIEPFGMTALMQVFFKVTEGQEPNPEWEAKLDNLTGRFGELKKRAAGWTTTQPEGASEAGDPDTLPPPGPSPSPNT